MTEIIFAVLSYILLYNYVTLFLVSYFATIFIILPSNTALLAAAAFASQGYLNIYLVIIVALFANVLGDVTGFLLSDKFGYKVLMKTFLRKVLLSEEYNSTEKFMFKYSRTTIFVTRFFGGVSLIVNILSGMSNDIPFKKFIIYDILGEIVYVMSFVFVGYYLGDTWQDIILSVGDISLIITFLLFSFFVVKYLHKKIRINNERKDK